MYDTRDIDDVTKSFHDLVANTRVLTVNVTAGELRNRSLCRKETH